MQPQDPSNPMPPAPQPPQPPMPSVPDPQAPPSGMPSPNTGAPVPPSPMSGMPAPTMASTSGDAGSKKKMIMIVVAVVAVLIVIVGGWFGYQMFFGGIKLEKFSNDNISLMVPVGYTKNEENGGGTWTAKGKTDTDNSTVIAYYQAYPQELTDSQLVTVKKELKTELEGAANSVVNSSTDKIESVNVTDIKFKGQDAVKLTATASQNGKKIGDITLIAVANKKAVYLVGVAARTTDSGLVKKTDTIINSFDVKN